MRFQPLAVGAFAIAILAGADIAGSAAWAAQGATDQHRALAGVSCPAQRSFDADGERQVTGRDRLWFRNGGCASGANFSRDGGHQSKIYAELNHSSFRKIFGGFISMETLRIYRRLVVRNKAAV